LGAESIGKVLLYVNKKKITRYAAALEVTVGGLG
jgi:hypothetical protein